MIETLRKKRIEENFLNLRKSICNTPTDNVLNGERQNAFLSKDQAQKMDVHCHGSYST
jgi:hypothetical protein